MTVTEAPANGTTATEHPGPKVRLVRVIVQLDLVVDDGTLLDPLQVQQIQVDARDWPAWDINEVVAQAQEQVTERARV